MTPDPLTVLQEMRQDLALWSAPAVQHQRRVAALDVALASVKLVQQLTKEWPSMSKRFQTYIEEARAIVPPDHRRGDCP